MIALGGPRQRHEPAGAARGGAGPTAYSYAALDTAAAAAGYLARKAEYFRLREFDWVAAVGAGEGRGGGHAGVSSSSKYPVGISSNWASMSSCASSNTEPSRSEASIVAPSAHQAQSHLQDPVPTRATLGTG